MTEDFRVTFFFGPDNVPGRPMIRAKVEPEDFIGYERRDSDLFIQQVCWAKLDLAIASGMSQDNQTIVANVWEEELQRQVLLRRDNIRQAILTELDL